MTGDKNIVSVDWNRGDVESNCVEHVVDKRNILLFTFTDLHDLKSKYLVTSRLLLANASLPRIRSKNWTSSGKTFGRNYPVGWHDQ